MIGRFKYSDISVVLSVMYTSIILLRYGEPKGCRWKYWIYAYLGLSIVSAITAWFFYNQSLLRGIFVQRCQLSYLFLFLGVERLFELKKIQKDDIIHYTYLLCWIELLLCTIQYLMYSSGGTLFMRVGNNLRYESVRLYFDPGLILMVAFHAYESALKGKNRIRNVIFVIWTMIFLVIITKMRMMTAAFLVSLAIGLLIWKGTALKKILYISLGGGVGLFALSKIALFQDLLQTVSNLEGDANYGVRLAGRSVFINELMKSPITGRGYPSVSSESATGILKGYLFVDNGIWGLIYSYGILGLVWWIGMWCSVLKRSWSIRKYHMFYFLYFLYYTVGLMTDFAWFWTATSSFVVVVAMLFEEIREKDKMEVYENI